MFFDDTNEFIPILNCVFCESKVVYSCQVWCRSLLSSNRTLFSHLLGISSGFNRTYLGIIFVDIFFVLSGFSNLRITSVLFGFTCIAILLLRTHELQATWLWFLFLRTPVIILRWNLVILTLLIVFIIMKYLIVNRWLIFYFSKICYELVWLILGTLRL